jgi:hypothetical protein
MVELTGKIPIVLQFDPKADTCKLHIGPMEFENIPVYRQTSINPLLIDYSADGFAVVVGNEWVTLYYGKRKIAAQPVGRWYLGSSTSEVSGISHP